MNELLPDGVTVSESKRGRSEGDPDIRIQSADRDARIDRDDEFSDSEDEGEGGRRNKEDYKSNGAEAMDTA